MEESEMHFRHFIIFYFRYGKTLQKKQQKNYGDDAIADGSIQK